MKFYLGPYQPVDEGMGPSLSPPIASIGAINLGGSARNLGLFVLPNSETLGAAFRQIGRAASPDSVSISSIARRQWQSVFGLSETPIATTLTELIRETLMEHADGTGVNHVRPLVAGHDGRLKIWLFDRQIWGSRWNESNQDPRYNAAILRQLKDSYTAKRVANLLEQDEYRRRHYLRWLGYQKRKYNLDRAGWRAIQGDNPEEEPDRPETTITESWPTDGAITSGQNNSWYEFDAGNWIVSGGKIVSQGSAHDLARCEVALSSDDQYCQVTKEVGGDTLSLGPVVRIHGSSTTEQGYHYSRYGGNGYLRYWWISTISYGSIGSQSLPETFRVEADGSSISGIFNGTPTHSATDTTVPSGSKCGVYKYGSGAEGDSWEAGDLGGGAVANSHYYLVSQAAAV